MMSVCATQHNSLATAPRSYYTHCLPLFQGRKQRENRADVLCSEKSGGVGSFALGTAFAFPAEPASRGGAFAASPPGPPCREPQRIYLYCNGEGDTLCTNDRGMCSCTPLPLLFCPPFWGRKDLTHFPAPPLHLDNKTHHYDLLSGVEAINRDCRFYNPALTYEDYGHLAEPGGQNPNAEITAKGGRLNDKQVS